MSGEDYLIIAALYLSGDLNGTYCNHRFEEYLGRAIREGNKRARFIDNNPWFLSSLYVYLEGTKAGGERAFKMLSKKKDKGLFSKYLRDDELPEFEDALKNFTPISPERFQGYKQSTAPKNSISNPIVDMQGMNPNDMFEKGIRYYIGEETGRQNATYGSKWLTLAGNAGHKRAQKIVSNPYPLYYAHIAGGEMGYTRAIKKVLGWHKNNIAFLESVPENDLIDFRKKAESMGYCYQ